MVQMALQSDPRSSDGGGIDLSPSLSFAQMPLVASLWFVTAIQIINCHDGGDRLCNVYDLNMI